MANVLMEIGKSALFASQASIQTTGNNIANVDTPGYTRQYVRQEALDGLDYRPGRMGQGVNAAEVLRYFDAFLEKSYVDKHSTSSRWDQDYTLMSSVENIFNEANRVGISSQMSAFFSAWQDLSLRPQDMATREALLSQSDSLAGLIQSTDQSIRFIQDEMDTSIRVDVDRANELISSIYNLNVQIKANTQKGVNNPNDLMDKRDQLTRQLSEILDVTVSDRDGEYYLRTKSGAPLVDDVSGYYSLAVQGPKAETHLAQLATNPAQLSDYAGKVNFSGSDSYEYTLEIVNGGNAAGDPAASPPIPPDVPPPQFRVSLDGGKTWLKDDNGKDLLYDIPPNDSRTPGETMEIQVKNLKISFEDQTNNNTNFNAGDRFVITPKTGVYFVAPTKGSTEGLPSWENGPYTGPQNLTPQSYFDGTENGLRITGGSLAAYFNIRDNICGGYLDRLDAVSNSMIWEVNNLHSQGVGLEKLQYLLSDNAVADPNVALGKAYSGLDFFDRLSAGNLTFHIYDKQSGDYIGGGNPLVFPPDPGPPPGTSTNFDPARHTLQDVADALNAYTITDASGQTVLDSLGNPVNPFTAQIISGKLQITAKPEYTFATGSDSTGLLAALGLNAFFTGSRAGDIAVNADVRNDPNRVAAGKVDGAFEGNVGDNDTAKAMAALLNKPVYISTMWQKTSNQSLNAYYNSLVAKVGTDTLSSKNNASYSKALNDDLEARQSAVAGVNLDEEMTNLIRFQHSYTAAAKLITTADQMMQTILGLKQ